MKISYKLRGELSRVKRLSIWHQRIMSNNQMWVFLPFEHAWDYSIYHFFKN